MSHAALQRWTQSIPGHADSEEGWLDMTTNRFLEAIKRLLSAETYFRSRKETGKHEPEPPAPEDKQK